ncbi:aspartate aminotransferase family protein [Desmospora profundinema]|uniref:Acetylornithine aminotransferase n=1 Tax=Desmospora profundinema TaxID=1571184 RepID=A0ABU1ILC4_9BACL|nr:aspartate aminotransferase family protein [Desmospora profundinema]MDR6225582.1 acetylornithine aminotransferase [Desmospora profundinema]
MGLFPTYRRNGIRPVEASGVTIKDEAGRSYLDFTSGLGVCNLGHGHPRVKAALERQWNAVWHVSNLFEIPLQEKVSNRLAELSGLSYAFFCNSGAEANEAAIKLARRYAQTVRGVKSPEILTFETSFHGRTLATLTATGQEKVKVGFGPLPSGFIHVPFNDMESFRAKIGPDTAAVLLELVQGEGGVRPADHRFMQAVAAECRRHGALLIVDEVQTGMGRTGELFAFQGWGIQPDVVTLAKGLGNGFPIGVMLGRAGLEESFGPGTHASTFGGNPLAMAVADAVLDCLCEPGFLEQSRAVGERLGHLLRVHLEPLPGIRSVRGLGWIWGLELDRPSLPLVQALAKRGLLVTLAGERVLRLLPPLVTTEAQVERAVMLIEETWMELEEVVTDGSVSGV